MNLMSYDGGTYYDSREGYESYRAIYAGPIAPVLEVAPEGSGGAVLKLNDEQRRDAVLQCREGLSRSGQVPSFH